MSLTPCSPPRRRGGADGRAGARLNLGWKGSPPASSAWQWGEVERTVPVDEAPPLPPNAELRRIGKPVRRWNGEQKVAGTARFTADVVLPGMLHVRLFCGRRCCMRASGRLTSAPRSAPQASAPCMYILGRQHGGATAAAPGETGRRRLASTGVAVHAGRRGGGRGGSPEAAEEATRRQGRRLAIAVRVDMTSAAPGAPVVFQKLGGFGGGPAAGLVQAELPLKGNVRGPSTSARGDAAAGLAAADVVVEDEYRTQVQSHCCLEPHGIVVDWRADGLTAYLSIQTRPARAGTGPRFRPAAEPRPRHRRSDGRRLRFQARRSALRPWPPSRCRARPKRRFG